MAYVGPVRKELGFPTVFNILGPLLNPASPDAMVMGVHSKYLGQVFAEALTLLGMKSAWVVCGFEGLDEISTEGQTHVGFVDFSKNPILFKISRYRSGS